MQNRRHSFLRLGALAAASGALFGTSRQAVAQSAPAGGDDRVVYHVNDTSFARGALTNMTNHLDNAPHAKVALLANGLGVKMLVQGEWDRHGSYATEIKALQARGARFIACRTALAKQEIEPARLVVGVTSVPAGVVELTRLQSSERYAYIKA